MFSVIVAYNQDRVIGSQGKIPWHLPEDMDFFKKTTSGHAVIMGSKTWYSIPIKYRPLSNRLNIVLTSKIRGDDDGCNWISSIEDVQNMLLNYNLHGYVIGGEQVYHQFLELNIVSEVIATEVVGRSIGDTFLPELKGDWTRELIKESKLFNIFKYKKVVFPDNP